MRQLILYFSNGTTESRPLSSYKPESRRAGEADERVIDAVRQEFGARLIAVSIDNTDSREEASHG